MFGFRQGFFNIPSTFQTTEETGMGNARFAFPLSHCLFFAESLQASIISFIICLGNPKFPDAIIRRVALVIINALDSMGICWAPSHIFKEQGKVIPASTYCNTPAVVITKIFHTLRVISTSFPHRFPYRIFRQMRQAVNGITLSGNISTPTSTAFCVSRPYFLRTHRQHLTTFTSTQPNRLTQRAPYKTQHGQPMKGLPFQINEIVNSRLRKKLDFRNVNIGISHCEKVTPFSYLMRAVRGSRLFQPAFIVS